MIKTVRGLVNRLGGADVLSRHFGISKEAIHNWVRKEKIPAARRLDIHVLAVKKGLRLQRHLLYNDKGKG